MSALDATKWRDINFQTKSVWFDPKFFSWSVRARPGVMPNGRTLVRNHARSIVACDFLVVVTRPVANSLCVPPRGGRDKAHRALQGHRTSNGDRDLAAASRSDSQRSFSA